MAPKRKVKRSNDEASEISVAEPPSKRGSSHHPSETNEDESSNKSFIDDDEAGNVKPDSTKKDDVQKKIPDNLPTLKSLYKNKDLLWLFSKTLITPDYLDRLDKADSIYERMMNEKDRLIDFIFSDSYKKIDKPEFKKITENLYNHFNYVETVVQSRETWENIKKEAELNNMTIETSEDLDNFKKGYEYSLELQRNKGYTEEFPENETEAFLDDHANLYNLVSELDNAEKIAAGFYDEIKSWGFNEEDLPKIVEKESGKRVYIYQKPDLPSIVDLDEINKMQNTKSGALTKKKQLALFLYDFLNEYITGKREIFDNDNDNDGENYGLEIAEDGSMMVKLKSHTGRFLVHPSGVPIVEKRFPKYHDLTYDQLITNVDFLDGLVKGKKGYGVQNAFDKLDGIYEWDFYEDVSTPDSYKAQFSDGTPNKDNENEEEDGEEDELDEDSRSNDEQKSKVDSTFVAKLPDLVVPRARNQKEAYEMEMKMKEKVGRLKERVDSLKEDLKNKTNANNIKNIKKDILKANREYEIEKERLKRFTEVNVVPDIEKETQRITKQLNSVVKSISDLANIENNVSAVDIINKSIGRLNLSASLETDKEVDKSSKVGEEVQVSGNLTLGDLENADLRETLQKTREGVKLLDDLQRLDIEPERLNEMVTDLQYRILNLEREREEYKSSIIDIETSAAVDKAQIKDLLKQVNDLRTGNEEERNKNIIAEQQLENLRTSNRLLKITNENLAKEADATKLATMALTDQIERLKKKERDEIQSNGIGRRMVNSERRFSRQRQNRNMFSPAKFTNQRQMVDELTDARFSRLRAENINKELRLQLTKANDRIDRLTEENKALTDNYNNLERENQRRNTFIEKYDDRGERIEALMNHLGELNNRVKGEEELRFDRHNLDESIRLFNNEKQGLETALAEATREKEESKKELDRLKLILENTQQQNQRLAMTNITLRNREENIDDLFNVITEQDGAIEHYRDAAETYEMRIDLYDRKINELVGNDEKTFKSGDNILETLENFINTLKREERRSRQTKTEEINKIANEMVRLKTEYDSVIDQLNTEHEKQLETLKAQHEDDIKSRAAVSSYEQEKMQENLEKGYQITLDEAMREHEKALAQLTEEYNSNVEYLQNKVKEQEAAIRGLNNPNIDEYYRPYFDSARVVLTQFNDLVTERATESIPILKELFGVFIGDIRERLEDKRRTEMEMFRHNLNLAQEAAKHSYEQQRRSETHAYRTDFENRAHLHSIDLAREKHDLRVGEEQRRWEAERDRDEARGFRGTNMRAVRNRYVSDLIGGLVGSNNPVAVAQGYALLTEFTKSLMELPADELNNPDIDSFLNMYDQGSLDRLVTVLAQPSSNTVNDALAKRMSDLENTTRSFINMVSQRTAHVGAAQAYHPPRRVFVGRDGVAHQGNRYARRRGSNNRKLPPRKSNGQFKRASSRRTGNKRK